MSDQLANLAVVLREKKVVLIALWKADVRKLASAARLDASALSNQIPQFIDEMIAAVAGHKEAVVVEERQPGSPPEHGSQRRAAGFNIKEVVVEYNVLRGAVLDLTERAGLRLTAREYRVIHNIIDDAIARAVDMFAREQSAQRQRERDEHLAFVAHNVRTPLNAIHLIATLLAEELGPDAHESAELLHVMERNVQRIDELVQRVMREELTHEAEAGLHLARREIDLWPLVHQLLQDLHPVTSAAQIKIRNLVSRNLTVNADANLIVRALQNLVSNSIKFAPGGEIEIGAEENAAGVKCWVKDNGLGIAPERIERVFEKRETDADPAHAGFGLGLAIFKQIIETHGGKVSVESRPGQGTTFLFTIPRPSPGA